MAIVLKTDRTVGLTHTPYFQIKTLEVPLGSWGWSWNLARFPSEQPLPVVCPGPMPTPLPGKDQNGGLLSMAVYVLFPRAFVFYLGMGPYIQGNSSGRIRRHQLLVRSACCLGHGPFEHLRRLPQVDMGAQQGGLPSTLPAQEFYKAMGAHLCRSHMPISKKL